jgi:hypothetical protein
MDATNNGDCLFLSHKSRTKGRNNFHKRTGRNKCHRRDKKKKKIKQLREERSNKK